jgi:DNA-binding beta-propeller fold protein YncE
VKTIAVEDPYNLYFTPDGHYAIVVAEGHKKLQFRNPQTMQLISTLPTQCGGANHMEFSEDGQFAIVTCEYSAQLMKVDLVHQKVVGYLHLNPSKPEAVTANSLTIGSDGRVVLDRRTAMADSMPQDIRASPDGSKFFVADMMRDGLFVIDPVQFRQVGFIPTGRGTHAIYPSRDGTRFYISNRGCHHMSCGPHGPGTISVVDPALQKVIATWVIPHGGSTDMGNLSTDGKELWLSGRYDSEIYVFDTTTGQLLHRIPVGNGPHGLTYWPQPGRYSLGHTGNMR